MSTARVILIAGVRKSGKNTVGDILEDQHNYHQTSFAAPLKRMASIAFPHMSDKQLYGPSQFREDKLDIPLRGLDPRNGRPMVRQVLEDGSHGDGPTAGWRADDGAFYGQFLTPRLILQTLGTEWGRRLYADIWVDACLKNVMRKTMGKWVITDGRFRNEIKRVKERGGVVVKLQRGFEESRQRAMASNSVDTHPTESELLSVPDSWYDHVIDNTGSLEELPALVNDMLCQVEAQESLKAP